MTPFTSLRSEVVLLPASNLDTDQIIPARFLSRNRKRGLGDCLFYDQRFNGEGTALLEHPLNAPSAKRAQILLAGANFGCGSSREPAVYALRDFGFRAVIAPSFGDIFAGNAANNGLLPTAVAQDDFRRLIELLSAPGNSHCEIDLTRQRISVGVSDFRFEVDPDTRRRLLHGIDEFDELLAMKPAIEAFALKLENEWPWNAAIVVPREIDRRG